MTRGEVKRAYALVLVALGAVCLLWFGLNKLRVRLYDPGILDPHSWYYRVVTVQDILAWIIGGLALALAFAVIYEFARFIATKISG